MMGKIIKCANCGRELRIPEEESPVLATVTCSSRCRDALAHEAEFYASLDSLGIEWRALPPSDADPRTGVQYGDLD